VPHSCYSKSTLSPRALRLTLHLLLYSTVKSPFFGSCHVPCAPIDGYAAHSLHVLEACRFSFFPISHDPAILPSISHFPLCPTLILLPHPLTSNEFPIMPWRRTKNAQRRTFSRTHSLRSSRTVARLAAFSTCFSNKFRSSISLDNEMKGGRGG
jgi:hypothetical protein